MQCALEIIMPHVAYICEIGHNPSVKLPRDAARRALCVALFPEEDPKDEPVGFGTSDEAI
jgi:hypothetical protein